MSVDLDRVADRVSRNLEEQRRKLDSYAAMMEEVQSSSEDSEDDAPVRRPTRGAGRGRGRGAASVAGTVPSIRPQSGTPTTQPLPITPILTATAPPTGRKASLIDDDDGPKFGFAKSAALPEPVVPIAASSGKKKDKLKEKDVDREGTPSPAPVDADPAFSVNPSTLRPFLMRPADFGAPVTRCHVLRTKATMNLTPPLWQLFLDDGNRFLMAAKNRVKSKTSNYLLSMEAKASDRKSPLLVGKLRSNWTGSGYTIYDNGMNPDKTVLETSKRRELAFVTYDYDDMGPGKMIVHIPRVSPSGAVTMVRPSSDADTLESIVSSSSAADKVMTLRNKRPKWDETIGGHVLNFQGRVTMSSVKNFQLVCDDTGDETVLQFGRVDKNKFTMDFRYPLSPFQAFAIALSAIDGKLADKKNFQLLKKITGKDREDGKK